VKKKIFKYFACMITVAILATTLLLSWVNYEMFKGRVMDDLEAYGRMFAVEMNGEAETQSALHSLEEDIRVTLVHADGTVYYDNFADPNAMDNHADRPEIRQALENGSGSDIRNSSTVDQSAFYYAVRLKNGDVMRLAQEASNIWSVYFRSMPIIMLLAAGMACVSLYLAHLLTARLVQPIERMTAHLNNVSGVARYPELEPFMDMIEQQHEEILRSANMRVEFTANVSHELKTPLTSISGYAELIESGMAQGEQAKTFAAEIHKSANRLLTLINDIIRLSQMDAPMPDLKFEPVDLAQIAANTFEQLEMSARKADVTLQLDAKPAMVEADRQMMDELLYNLCDNAIRYNVHGGSVKLEIRPIRDKVIVCVQDTGIGISPENQEHVFERFYRVDKSRSKATGGTGLGLAIVKHIAVKHNAQIELESELGRGTRISVIFERCFKG
jgi:two-component system phosphate regulon sensor histidine kinase PhoR